MAKSYRWRIGDIIEIPLPERKAAYAVLLESPLIAFFEGCHSRRPSSFESQTVKFYAWVHHDALRTARWIRVGKAEKARRVTPWFFKLDAVSKKLMLQQHGTAEEKPASVADVLVHDPAWIWYPEDIEKRLVEECIAGFSKEVEDIRQFVIECSAFS